MKGKLGCIGKFCFPLILFDEVGLTWVNKERIRKLDILCSGGEDLKRSYLRCRSFSFYVRLKSYISLLDFYRTYGACSRDACGELDRLRCRRSGGDRLVVLCGFMG